MASRRSADHGSESPEGATLTRDYNDNADFYFSSSHESQVSMRRPLSNFRTEEENDKDIEDTFVKTPARGRKSWRKWWDTVKREGYTSLDGGEAQLPDGHDVTRMRKKGNWYNCCIFSSISGLCLLAFLLSLNLLLGLVTLSWTSNIDGALGEHGTGIGGLARYPTDFTRGIVPIPCHSHNDYWQELPLFSALRAGCIGVEADVWLFNEELYVGHNPASLTRDRTFASLYVDPLFKILENQNPSHEFYNGTSHGVFDEHDKQTLTLLVDLKTNGIETWPWVLKQVQPLRDRGWLSFVENNKVHKRPITLVGSGKAPFDLLMANSTYRDTFFDAPLEQLLEEDNNKEKSSSSSSSTRDLGEGHSGTLPDTKFNKTNSYYASARFSAIVGKISRSRLSSKQMKIIRDHIKSAHKRGLKARFWDLPAWPLGLRNYIWNVLVEEGIDLLNVDNLGGASEKVW